MSPGGIAAIWLATGLTVSNMLVAMRLGDGAAFRSVLAAFSNASVPSALEHLDLSNNLIGAHIEGFARLLSAGRYPRLHSLALAGTVCSSCPFGVKTTLTVTFGILL